MRVVVTRAGKGNEPLASLLRAEGFEVLECPLVAIEPIAGPPIRAAGYDWVVLTSRVAVELLLERLEGPLPPVAAIGPGTAEALRARGIEPQLVAEQSTQEGLVAALPQPAGRVLFPGAEGARDVLTRELRATLVPLYRTVPIRPQLLPEGDLVLLASPSAARSLAALRLDLPCASIGPATSAEARACGLTVAAEAARHDVEGLVEAAKLVASQTHRALTPPRSGGSSPS